MKKQKKKMLYSDRSKLKYKWYTSLNWEKNVMFLLQYGGARFKQRLDKIKWALCVPASCSALDVETYLKSYIKENGLDMIENVSVADNMCTQALRPGDEYSVYDIAFV